MRAIGIKLAPLRTKEKLMSSREEVIAKVIQDMLKKGKNEQSGDKQ